MSVVKIIELVGESPIGWEDAMKQVIEEAQKTVRGITRIGVIEQDVRMINDRIDVWRSTDKGTTWDKLKSFSPRSAGGSNECYVPDRFLELSDGSWLLSTSCYAWIPGLRKGIRGDTERLDFYRSTDNGQTWTFLSGPLASPPHILSEPSTVEIAPGRYAACWKAAAP